jgi:predicted ATP-binding protein involved in virulence
MGRSDEAARLAASLEGPDAMEMEDSGVIQAIVDLDYRSYRENQPRIRKIIEGIGSIVSEITEGFPVKFVGVGEDKRGLFPRFKTPDGLMALNTLSQGTQSLIQWLGHFLINLARYYGYPDEIASKRSVLIIDEIDAHLHPSWQRRILPALTKAFPRLQIFCSSHSPLMPTGLKAGQVHLLSRDSRNRVTVSRNETDVVGWSADEILRGLMDVSDPIDLETVEQLERLQTLRQKKRLSKHDASELDSLRKNVGSKLSTGPATNKILAMAAELAAPAHSGRKGNGPRVRRAAKNASSGK